MPADRDSQRRARTGARSEGWPAAFAVSALAALCAAVVAAPVAGLPAAATGPLPTIGLDELAVGQRGYGLTVFTGSEPERFEAEVIGIMRNVSPETSFILARLSGRGLEEIGVAGGMSGSPVFFDGRLAGAVAFSWPFSTEPIAGITPIRAMREIPTETLPPNTPWGSPSPVPAASGGPPVEVRDLASGRLAETLLEQSLGRLAPRLPGGGVPGIQWSLAGFGPRSEQLLQRALGERSVAAVAPVGEMAAGGDGGSAAAELAPGSPVAAVLIDGDLKLAATGTVTDVADDQVLAFGHPFLGLGPVQVPMAVAEVVTVLSSRYSSFKIANVGPVLGSFQQDRAAGVRGRIGAAAPTVPLRVRVRGEDEREFRMELASMPLLTPSLLAAASLGSLDAASYAGGVQGLDLTARFELAGHPDLVVEQSFDGNGAATQAMVLLFGYATFLLDNEMETVQIERIEVDLAQSSRPRTATLAGAHAERTVVQPGETVSLNLDFNAYRGDRFRRSVEIPLPASLPGGRYHLFVGDGPSTDAARLALEKTEPETLHQALDFLSGLHSNRELVVLGVLPAPGLAVAGEVLPDLPGSIRSLWASGASSAKRLRLAITQEMVRDMPMPVSGLLRVDLEIDRREALTAESAGDDGSAVGDEGAPAVRTPVEDTAEDAVEAEGGAA